MSSVAEKRGDLDQAIDYAKDVLVQNDAAGLKNMSLRSTAQLASLYEQKKDYKTALEYQKMNMNWRDSIYNEEKDAPDCRVGGAVRKRKKQAGVERGQGAKLNFRN